MSSIIVVFIVIINDLCTVFAIVYVKKRVSRVCTVAAIPWL
jgi:hypothetical protein